MPSDNILHQSNCTWLCSLLCQLLDGIIDVTLFDGVEGLHYNCFGFFQISEGKNQRQIPKTDNDGFNRFHENGFIPIQNNNFRHHRAGPIHIPNRRIFKVLRVLGGGGRQMKVKIPNILKLSQMKSSM